MPCIFNKIKKKKSLISLPKSLDFLCFLCFEFKDTKTENKTTEQALRFCSYACECLRTVYSSLLESHLSPSSEQKTYLLAFNWEPEGLNNASQWC